MSRLLVNGEWYDAVASESMYESSYEAVLLENAAQVFPGFHAARFKKRVRSDYGNAEADLALIDRWYRNWWVVEVELSSHPLRGHVEEQVAVFASAHYGENEAAYLAAQDDVLDLASLRAMMLGNAPRVLVLVNAPKPEWATSLGRYDALVGVAELFRSDRNRHILRVNGDIPRPLGSDEFLSVCRLDSLIPRALVVESPAALVGLASEDVTIWYDGVSSRWMRNSTAARVHLFPVGRFPLSDGQRTFSLIRSEDGRLELIAQREDVRRVH